MPDVDLKYAIGLEPTDAVAYFEAKGLKISGDWHEVWRESNAKAFTVANLSKMDVLQDVHGGLSQALKDGKTERWFDQTLTPILQAKGWWGKAVDESTGEITQTYPGTSRPVQYGSPRRLKLIYRTNLQTAYMAGRWKAQAENADHRPYLQYVAVMDSRTRPAHKALNGQVYRLDDPVWQYLYPPNGWNCRCRVRALTERQVRDKGLKIESSTGRIDTTEVRVGQDANGNDIMRPVHRLRYTDTVDGREKYFQPDAGWDYNPGMAGKNHAVELFTRSLAQSNTDIGVTAMAAAIQTLRPMLIDEFQAWATPLLAAMRHRGEIKVVGALNLATLDFLRGQAIEPDTAAITIKDAELLHLARDAKEAVGKALPVDVLLLLPDIIARPKAILWDKQDNAVLYVFDPVSGDARQGKVVVRVNYMERSRVDGQRVTVTSNAIRSGGLVALNKLKDKNAYEVIDGTL